jgi:hypothetical protein
LAGSGLAIAATGGRFAGAAGALATTFAFAISGCCIAAVKAAIASGSPAPHLAENSPRSFFISERRLSSDIARSITDNSELRKVWQSAVEAK